MSEQHRGVRWVRWAGEAVIIVISVFVAILLEGKADDSASSADAHTSLAQLTAELRSDQEDLARIRRNQVELAGVHDDLLRWLASPASLPGDSVQAALDHIAFLNLTMYPRKGAWGALASGGQLVWVRDQGLVTRLANFYESTHSRLEYAGRDYDYNVNDVSRVTMTRAWDFEGQRPRMNAQTGIAELWGQIRYLRLSWNQYYIELLDDYGAEMETLLGELEAYLRGRAP